MNFKNLIAGAILITAASSFAQDPSSRNVPRMNSNLESEGGSQRRLGGGIDGGFFRWLADSNVLSDGQAQLSYQGRFFDGGGRVQGVTASLETRLFRLCDGQYYYSDFEADRTDEECRRASQQNGLHSMLMIPMETVVRINVRDENAVDIQKIKIGVIRLLFGQAGITIQAASFLQQQFETSPTSSLDSTFRGVEIFDFSLTRTPRLNESGSVQLVFKLRANLSFGHVSSGDVDNYITDAIQDFRDQVGPVISTDRDPTYSRANGFATIATIGTSLGIRIHQRVVLEIFSQLQSLRNPYGAVLQIQGEDSERALRGAFGLLNINYGTQVTVLASENVSIFGRVDANNNRLDFGNTINVGPNPQVQRRDVTITGGLQVNW